MKRLFAGALLAAGVMGAPPCGGAADTAPFAAVERYAEAIGRLQSGVAGRGSLEEAYRTGQEAAAVLVPVLESLSPERYDAVARKMRGFVLNRDEVVFALPDATFYLGLAQRHGTDADIAFFTFMSAFRPDNVWPAFVEQQTDYSGCSAFGSGTLTHLYGKAASFRKEHPSTYRQDVEDAIGLMRDELIAGDCACGGMDSVIGEFELFIAAFPLDELTPAVRKRLLDVRRGSSTIRSNCVSG